MVDAILGTIPVWLIITPLVGTVNAALFFLIAGRRPLSLPLYVVLGSAAASMVQGLGVVEPSGPPLSLGDVHLVATTVASWAVLAVTRAIGF